MKRRRIGTITFFLTAAFLYSFFVLSCDVLDDSGSTAFKVMETIPADGDTDVPPSAVISLSFSVEIDPATATNNTIQVTDSLGRSVAGKVSAYGVAVSFAPTDRMESNASYSVTIKAQLMDIYGRNLDSDVSFSFTTAGE